MIWSNWFKKYFSDPEAFTILAVLFFVIVVFSVLRIIIVPVVLSITITYLLNFLVKKLEDWNLSHLVAVIITFSLFLGFLLLLLLLLFPLLWQQLVNFLVSVPQIVDSSQKMIVKLHNMYPTLISVDHIKQLITGFAAQLASFTQFIFTFSRASIAGMINFSVYLILVPLLVFFFLKDKDKLLKWAVGFLPRKHLVLNKIWKELGVKLGCYVRGKFLEITVVAIVTSIAFMLFGLEYAILFGILVGLSVLIPYIGAIIATIPIVIMGLVQWGFSLHFFYLIAVYAVISVLDSNVLAPLLFSGVMDLHPVAVILAVLVFGSIGGFWGIVFATPLAALLQILLKFWPRRI